jgi:hypothetical protein
MAPLFSAVVPQRACSSRTRPCRCCVCVLTCSHKHVPSTHAPSDLTSRPYSRKSHHSAAFYCRTDPQHTTARFTYISARQGRSTCYSGFLLRHLGPLDLVVIRYPTVQTGPRQRHIIFPTSGPWKSLASSMLLWYPHQIARRLVFSQLVGPNPIRYDNVSSTENIDSGDATYSKKAPFMTSRPQLTRACYCFLDHLRTS